MQSQLLSIPCRALTPSVYKFKMGNLFIYLFGQNCFTDFLYARVLLELRSSSASWELQFL